MTDIDRIRPQSKRKAINAAAFFVRYRGEAIEARKLGQQDRAQHLFEKSRYWLERYERLAGHG